MTEALRCVITSRHETHAVEAHVGYLCFDCYGRLRSSVLELPAIAGWLHVNLAAGGAAGEQRVSGTREDPIPLRQDVLDLIGPDSRHWVRSSALPEFLLYDGATVIGAYTAWTEAEAAWRQVMADAGVSPRLIGMLRRAFTADEWRALSEEDKAAMDAAHTRWQVRPTEVGGWDQRGEDAIRARLFWWVEVMTAEGGFDQPERFDLLPVLAEWIAGHLSWVALQPWVDELFEEIRKTASEAHALVPWRAETRRDSEPCVCGVRAVVWHIADGFTRCEHRMGGCGRVQQVSEHQMNANLPETRRAG